MSNIDSILQQVTDEYIFSKESLKELLLKIQTTKSEWTQLEYENNDNYSVDLFAKDLNKKQNLILSIYKKTKKFSQNKKANGILIQGQDFFSLSDISNCFQTFDYIIQATEYNQYFKSLRSYISEEINERTIPYIKTLNINKSYLNIRSQKAKTIAENISKCYNLSQLIIDLSLNYLGSLGAASFSIPLKSCLNLQKVYFNFKFQNTFDYKLMIGEEGIQGLSEGLRNHPSIQSFSLILDNNEIGFGLKYLIQNLNTCQNLMKLHLSLNNCMVQYSSYHTYSLNGCQNLTQFSLNLFNGNITPQIVKGLTSSLSLQYFSLDLRQDGQIQSETKKIKKLFFKNKQMVQIKLIN
ncbi:kinase domain protein, putative (macronuclear) [Tetrahymena thermophila SB210]|uniref:Kinase domain protein, putative n=1 Tax=Tetrahymena thermophila (strain SB210) TaxID=312017 RepID=I7LZK8_TETTS|nr:kinase domain protein, putative [Tetrahymena thermophila SB210]EAR84120.2 kinase domain protein, putative [Tetrahymena thermophila SB210]|eukprot:XP_001031783.2 kinase domain protein, putative [Tetrahymena thermophila SB210]